MTKSRTVIVLKKGDDFFQELTNRLHEKGITSGFLYGIGGFTQAELAVFRSDTKQYVLRTFTDNQLEVLNITGDISKGPDGKMIIHCHTVLSGHDYRAIGGHLMSATVGATCELTVEPLDHQLTRVFDHDAGINTIIDR